MHLPVSLLVVMLSAQAPLVQPPNPPAQQPQSPAPSSPAPPQPQKQPSILDLLLGGAVPEEPSVEGLPVIQPGQPRPVIAIRFDFGGPLSQAQYFKEETLRTFVKHPLGKPLDEDLLNRDAEFIEQQYKLRGFLKARITWSKQEVPQGDIIEFHLDSGPRGALKQVEVAGNVGVPDEELLQGMFHKAGGLQNILAMNLENRGGVFHAGYVDQDIRQLLKNYEEHGYFAAEVTGVGAYSLDDKGDNFRLVFSAHDGPLYKIGLLKLSGDLPYDDKRTLAVLGVKSGDGASLKRIKEGTERVLDLWRRAGYASAKVDIEKRRRDETHELDVILRFTRGPLTRVGKITIKSDAQSAILSLSLPGARDRIVMRDLAVHEGQTYSLDALRISEERLIYTGLFQKVSLKPVPTDDPAVVDVEVEVAEVPSLLPPSLAPAYIPGEGLAGIAIWQLPNLGGTGLRFLASGMLSPRRQMGSFSIEEPRLSLPWVNGFMHTRLGVALSGNWIRVQQPEVGVLRRGGGVRLSYPFIERTALGLSYSLELINIDSPTRLEGFLGTPRFPNGKRRGVVRLDGGIDLRDNQLFPTRGILIALSLEHGSALWGGEIDFLTLSGNFRFYIPLPLGFVIKNSTSGAQVFSPTGAPIPVTERYFEGGQATPGYQTVRGYNFYSISPDVPLGDPFDPAGRRYNARIGGVSRFVNNLEVQTPTIPVTPLTPVALYAFLDAGNTWSEYEHPFFFPKTLSAERDGTSLPLGLFYSVGAGINLATSFFPIGVSIAIPLIRRNVDAPFAYYLTVGSTF